MPDWQALARDLVRVEARDASARPQDVRFTILTLALGLGLGTTALLIAAPGVSCSRVESHAN